MVKYSVKKLDRRNKEVEVYCDMGNVEIDRGVKMIQVRLDGEELSSLTFDYGIRVSTIFDIRSNVLRRGYATMLLSALIDIVKIHNLEIKNSIVLTPNLKDLCIIKSIQGSIIPVDAIIEYDELYRFYEKQGFIKDKRLLKLIE